MRTAVLSFLCFFFVITGTGFSQDTIKKDGFVRFTYPTGKTASEGIMRDGKPDAYWKTYYGDGTLKSEGNRKNFELDSLWKFYNEKGTLVLDIVYQNGKKNGFRTTYREGEILKENFVNDVKQGISTYYYKDGKIQRTVNFVNGLENGFAKEYDKEGNIISLIEYKRGFIVSRENINRRDKNGLKQGAWKSFYENGNVKADGYFKDDKKNGFFKEFASDGKLIRVEKYEMDVLIPDAEEVVKLDVKMDYYPDGKVKIAASYKNDVPEGIRRDYGPDGKIIKGYLYKKGKLIGEGITDEKGFRQGPWKEFFEDGKLKSEGKYKDGRRISSWKFYYQNGRTEEEGTFNNSGKEEGSWTWWYDNGEKRKEAAFTNGKEDGLMVEYDETGHILQKGEYVNGEEQGKWIYQMGDYKEEGSYVNGLRDGLWKSYYGDGTLQFEGRFVEDNPDGRHTYYRENGMKKDEGYYVMGKKEGEWFKYNEDGTIFLVVSYKNGMEKKYDGAKVLPEIENED
jgi:uncharacterized protein